MLAMVKRLLEAGVVVKIFTARACDPTNIPSIQDWTERQGLGRLEVTNQKDFDLACFFDDRAIPVLSGPGRSISLIEIHSAQGEQTWASPKDSFMASNE